MAPKQDEIDSIKEVEESFIALQEALYPVIEKQKLVANDWAYQENPSEEEFNLLRMAQIRFDTAKQNMQRIATEIRTGVRK